MRKEFDRFIAPVLWILLVVDFYLIFIHAPEEATQGMVQKIFYFHVSSAFAMYFGFLASGFFAFVYLIRRHCLFDVLSHAGASVGLLFCTMVLASGPVWAKPIWGAYWTWDPRLTTTLLAWLIFFACLLLRRFFEGNPKGAVYACVFTLFGVLDLPLIFLAVKLWRGIHPSVLGQKSSMPAEMRLALIATNLTVLLWFAALYWLCARILLAEKKCQVLRAHARGG